MYRPVLLIAVAAAAVSGCATSTSGNVYSRADARQAWSVDYGQVSELKDVTIEGNRTDNGVLAGALIGVALGATVGDGHGRDLAAATGAVAGGLAGQAAQERLTRTNGVQITVQTEAGSTISVVQGKDQSFSVGERVKILRRADGAARITTL